MHKQDPKCRLCGETAPLCRSHIVPDFAYAPIKDEDEKGQIFAVGRKVTKLQTGHWEYLLCSKCEGIFSGYETKFKKMWMDTIPADFTHLGTRTPQDPIAVEIPDYTSFKLFHLSVFWRAAVSTKFRDSRIISLGPHEKAIADMIREGNPGQPGDFPFFGTLMLDDKKRPVPTVSQLVQAQGRFEGRHHYYLMSYAFCEWVFVLARPGPRWLTDLETRCRDEGICILLMVPLREAKTFLFAVSMLQELRRSAK